MDVIIGRADGSWPREQKIEWIATWIGMVKRRDLLTGSIDLIGK